MALFIQDIKLNFSNDKEYIIEKVVIPKVNKGKVRIFVKPGQFAILPNTLSEPLFGRIEGYVFDRDDLISSKGEDLEVFLYKENDTLSLQLPFHAGNHRISLSSLKEVKGEYALVGIAYLEIFDYATFAKHFNKSINAEDAEEYLAENYRSLISEEIQRIAKNYILADADENSFALSLKNICDDLFLEGNSAQRMFRKIGLRLTRKGISMHVNSVGGTSELTKVIDEKIKEIALIKLEQPIRDIENDKIEREREFEINKIKAGNSKINETTINKTINGKEEKTKEKNTYCHNCGEKIKITGAKFCSNCGSKIGG